MIVISSSNNAKSVGSVKFRPSSRISSEEREAGTNSTAKTNENKVLLKIVDLPMDALRKIVDFTGDMISILPLANSIKDLFTEVNGWKCDGVCGCRGSIFATDDDGKMVRHPKEDATPWSCDVCEYKFCGRKGRRRGRCDDVTSCADSFKCNGCDQLNCDYCRELNRYNGCFTCISSDDYHCKKCQGECTKKCGLCKVNICDKHASMNMFDQRGVKVPTCGFHGFSVGTCSVSFTL
mmetsp:Transcript_21757/g.45597  ORF Transcript_21757/g.45597 Transcript_21757/m.45597 type:complete len:236 (+) Transcript_21757:63-770(+)